MWILVICPMMVWGVCNTQWELKFSTEKQCQVALQRYLETHQPDQIYCEQDSLGRRSGKRTWAVYYKMRRLQAPETQRIFQEQLLHHDWKPHYGPERDPTMV